MTQLFDRTVSVLVSRPVNGDFFRSGALITEIRDLRVEFQVEKHLGREPNTCEVKITNLAENTRAEFQTKPLKLRLEAGYDGSPQRLFTGDLRWGDSIRESTDWATTLQIADGGRAYRNGRVRRSYKRGVTALTAVKELARSMGLTVPRNALAASELASQFAAGIVLQGRSQAELTRVLDRAGMDWSIQDERLQILRKAETRPDAPITIDQDAGMIGVPEYGAPERKGKPPTLTVRTLLYPVIGPGMRIRMNSRQVRGLFRVERVAHTGDTRGDTWATEIEAKQL